MKKLFMIIMLLFVGSINAQLITWTAIKSTIHDSTGLKLTASKNLSDLANTTTARANLGVYSAGSVDTFLGAKLDTTLATALLRSQWSMAYSWGQGLKLDQTTPQTIINGAPIFNLGLASNGKMAIGSTSVPTDVALRIFGTDSNNDAISIRMASANVSGGELRFTKARGTHSSYSAVLSNDNLGAIRFRGYDGTGFYGSAYIQSDATENWSNTAHGSKLTFTTTSNTTIIPNTVLTLGQDKSATFTGTVTFPTPFTLGATSVTATGAEINAVHYILSDTTNWNTAFTNNHTHANKSKLDSLSVAASFLNSIIGNLGSNAYTSTAYVPTTRTINGYDLSANRTLSFGDIASANINIGTNTITAGLGLFGAGAGSFRNDAQIETAGTNGLLSIYQNNSTITNEAAIAFGAQNINGIAEKMASISSKMISNDSSTGYSVLRLNANFNGGATDYVALRIFGGNGVSIFGNGEADLPGVNNLLIRGNIYQRYDGALLGGSAYYNAEMRNAAGTKGLWFGYSSTEQLGIIGSIGGSSGISFWTHNGSNWGERFRLGTDGAATFASTINSGAITASGSSAFDTNTLYVDAVNHGVGIGTSTFGTSAAGVLGLGNGTAPSSSPADMIQLWSADSAGVAGKASLYVRDEAGNVTLLSPHPEKFLNKLQNDSNGLAWAYSSYNPYIGKRITVDMYGFIRDYEQRFGVKFITIEDLPTNQVEDWYANQDSIYNQREKQIADWNKRKVEADKKLAEYNSLSDSEKVKKEKPQEFTEKEPTIYVKKDAPTYMKPYLKIKK